MSFQAMTWAVDQRLPAVQKLVLLMLANRANHDTGDCFPSHSRLANECGMTKPTLRSAISALEEKGLLTVKRRMTDGVNLPNIYVLHIGQVQSQGRQGDCLGVGKELSQGRQGDCPGVGKELSPNQEDEPVIEPEDPPIAPQGADRQTKSEKFSPTDIDLPDWLPRESWSEWCTHRKQMRKPMTSLSATKEILFLQEQLSAGSDPAAVIEQAIRCGWQGLYPLKRSASNANENNHARVIRAHLKSYDFLDDADFMPRSVGPGVERGVRGARR